MTRTFVGRHAATGALLLAIGLLAPAGAGASTVATNAGVLTVDGGAGEVNQITIELVGAFYRVTDDTARLTTSDPDCTGSGQHLSRCDAAGVTSIALSGKSLNDSLGVDAATPATINGGKGADRVQGGAAADILIAGPTQPVGFASEELLGGGSGDILRGSTDTFANSTLNGGGGSDTFNGGPGADTMLGGPGADVFSGGDGTDQVSYALTVPSVTLTIDDVANDGAVGENDNIQTDIENIFGGDGDDQLTGSAAPNVVGGGGGTDIVRGGAGPDNVDGGLGADTVVGQSGGDTLRGGFGIAADVFLGGTGIDTASYDDHFDALTPLSITINDVANDGAAGENDDVRTDVEGAMGGAGSDTITGNGVANTLQGGNGGDTLNGGGEDDRLIGDFTFIGAPGAGDQLNGGTGDDVLSGGPAADDLDGAGGFDAADYTQIASPLAISINNVADDGTPGENDNVRTTIESVFGGSAGDAIVGNSAANVLFGGGGGDTINGGAGDDLLDGETQGTFAAALGDDLIGGLGTDAVSYASHGSPVTADPDNVADDGHAGENDNVRPSVENLFGGGSNDILTGSAGPNVLDGGGGSFFDTDTLTGLGGADFLSGGGGVDTANGNAGNDRIRSRGDSANDTDNCGADTDSVQADPFDTVNADCENVFGAAAPELATDRLEDQWRISREVLRRAERLVERARSGR
jgi:Ca2+-binding RTX toxin-like protein